MWLRRQKTYRCLELHRQLLGVVISRRSTSLSHSRCCKGIIRHSTAVVRCIMSVAMMREGPKMSVTSGEK
jgi:hypothetical protein